MNPYHDAPLPPAFRITPQLIVGLLIVFVGIVFTLDELGFAPALLYLKYWPVALIAIGLVKVLQSRDGGGAFAGLLFAGVGIWLQLEELDIIHVSLRDIWPLGLLLFGGYLVWQGLTQRRPAAPALESTHFPPLDSPAFESTPWPDAGSVSSDARAERTGHSFRDATTAASEPNATLSAMAIMGAVTRGNNSRAFRSGELLAIMGGLEIDLRKAAINGDAVIDIFALWGGIEIRVPENWMVVTHVVPLMGGVDDKTRPPQGATAHRLTLRGFVLMAGVEVKN